MTSSFDPVADVMPTDVLSSQLQLIDQATDTALDHDVTADVTGDRVW